MPNSFRQRVYALLDRLVEYEIDKAFYEYGSAKRAGRSGDRAFDRLAKLSAVLSDCGTIGRRLSRVHRLSGITTDDEWRDSTPGGLAEGKKPSEFSKDQLEKGIKVEKEHTPKEEVAQEIAQDHLVENDIYYDYLEDMEKDMKDDKEATNQQEIDEQVPTLFESPFPDADQKDELPPTDEELNAPSMIPKKMVMT